METAEAALRGFGEEALREKVEGLDGKPMSKLDYLYRYIAHEMYNRGQISIYEQLMKIEPALTVKFREFLAANG